MDNRIVDALVSIRDMYGDAVFYNSQKTKNLLSDIAPSLKKEIIQIINFLDINGYFQLKHAEKNYQIVNSRLVKNFISTYSVDEKTAIWVTNVFSAILGYNTTQTGAHYVNEILPGKHCDTEEALYGGKLENGSIIIDDAYRNVENVEQDVGHVKRPYYNNKISADFHSLAVSPDGRVQAAGINNDGQCNTHLWSNIIEVSAGSYFSVGLKENGTVVATGRNEYGQCNVSFWRDIVQISAGTRHTLGLKADGSVVATGDNTNGECNVFNWRNIIYVKAGCHSTFAIKKDRRVLSKGKNRENHLYVSHLNNVCEIAASVPGKTLALLTNGTIALIGRDNFTDKKIYSYKNIKQIVAAPDFFAVLLENGEVRLPIYFWEDSGVECSADDWKDIVAIAAGRHHIMGATKDGRVVAVMLHPNPASDKGQCRVGKWRV